VNLRATLRLQFHRGFTLADALPVVDYAARLGISHLYASPLTTAQPGSMHGYDVVDPTRINPELGGEPALVRLVERLRRYGMGLILDMVPNHMGVGQHNPWWVDVLRRGPASAYASFFDIDWAAGSGKLLLPMLGEPYGEALQAGHLRVLTAGVDDSMQAPFCVGYYDHRLPLRPESLAALGDPGQYDPQSEAGRARLHALLDDQHYRLACWRTAGDDINWRRFFDVNTLAGLQTQRAEVFEAVHGLAFRLYAQGLIDGLRIDHVDGLADPRGYCRRLRRRLNQLAGQRPAPLQQQPAVIVVEKILAPEEALPADWPVDGTTGYEFMDQVGAWLHDPGGETALTQMWASFSGRTASFEAEVHAARRQMVTENFGAELRRAALALHDIARREPATRDLTHASIERALAELVACFGVYRTYATPLDRRGADPAVFRAARERAEQHVRPADRPVLQHLDHWLGGVSLRDCPPGPARRRWRLARRRFEQLTSPVAAKAVEDTAGYRYGRLLSRNEVGADAGRFALATPAFHAQAQARRAAHPDALLVTATHDHKRGEDVRARLAVISEIPDRWEEAVRRWRGLNAGLRMEQGGVAVPDPADEYMLYQTLAGAWPLTLDAADRDAVRAFGERVWAWWHKALREGKRRSQWWVPDVDYEEGCRVFLVGALSNPEFPPDLARLVQRLAVAGAVNGLAQAALRLTMPGVPDLYQGTEWWDFSLVDPDNRRPVDFAARAAALEHQGDWEELVRQWRDGRIKQALIAKLLQLRQQHPDLFARGSYLPLTIDGPMSHHGLAFWREAGSQGLLVVVPHWPSGLLGRLQEPRLVESAWKGSSVLLPESGGSLADLWTGRKLDAAVGRLPLAPLFSTMPVGIALSKSG
jgi:(1->4)-alpha-D-glucan 1-alpha-D-glucosylmutase